MKTIFSGIFVCMAMLIHEVYAENYPLSPTLKINTVPDWVFASATYATPINFTIEGCDTANISKIEVTFKYSDGETTPMDITERFVANNGTSKNNGSSKTYTAYAPSSLYDSIELSNHHDSAAQYSLEVTCVPTIDGAAGEEVKLTSSSDDGKIANEFVDECIDCTEFPVIVGQPQEKTISLTSTHQLEAGSKSGQAEFVKFKWMGTPTSETVVSPPIYGFAVADCDEATAEYSLTGNTMGVKTRLYDDPDYNAGDFSYCAYKARVYGHARGGYFYVSYGGKTVDVLETGEYAMDLERKTGNIDMTLCKGNYTVQRVQDVAGGMSMSALTSSACNVAWALSTGPWAAAFGTAATVAAIIANGEPSGSNSSGKADGHAWLHRSVSTKTTGPWTDRFNLAYNQTYGQPEFNELVWARASTVGDQYFLSLNMASEVAAESTPPSIWPLATSIDCMSELSFVTEEDGDLDDLVLIPN